MRVTRRKAWPPREDGWGTYLATVFTAIRPKVHQVAAWTLAIFSHSRPPSHDYRHKYFRPIQLPRRLLLSQQHSLISVERRVQDHKRSMLHSRRSLVGVSPERSLENALLVELESKEVVLLLLDIVEELHAAVSFETFLFPTNLPH